MAAVAASQHGNITHEQLLSCGLTMRQICVRVARGSLFRVHDGVYAVGTRPLTDRARWMAAALACDGVVSHGSAAVLAGFGRSAPHLPHVTVARADRNPIAGLVVHATRRLPEADICAIDGIPATTAPRTLLDRAAHVGRRRLEREFSAARALGLASDVAIRAVLARHPRRPGGRALATVLLGPFTRSELERRFLALVTEHGLPAPRCNVPLHGFEVDCLWPTGLVVELDGRATHGVTAQVARDAAKDEALRAAGLTVERLTWWDVVRDGRRTVARIRDLLART